MSARRQAFTVVELMVVLALLVVLAGAAGLALLQGNTTIALQGGQAVLIQSLAFARTQAALSGRNAALAVSHDPAQPDQSLRVLAVALRAPSGASWIRVSAWIPLPAGVALLPPTSPSGAWVEPESNWTGLLSSALSTEPALVGAEPALLLEFTPRGTVVGGGGDLVLAPCRRQSPGSASPLVFSEPEAVRGVAVSAYGVAEWIHERAGF
ncbi:hypothetical protein MASR2M8_08870 [Opitutaceae bacterium]